MGSSDLKITDSFYKKLYKHPLFSLGLLIRIVLLAAVVPSSISQWYAPFLESSINAFSLDPWSYFLSSGGDIRAFPYGYVMWLVLLPGAFLCSLLGVDLYWGYGITLLCVDVLLLFILKHLFSRSNKGLLYWYWFSPVVIFATYWLGFNDLIPVALICAALHILRHRNMVLAGVLCGAAISAKASMVLPLPFFIIYLFRNRSTRKHLLPFCLGAAASCVVFVLPFLFSSGAMSMLFDNPEVQKATVFTIPIGDGLHLYILPMAYMIMLYVAWQVRRITFDLFFALLSIAFLLVLMLAPAAPGWFIWFVPLVLPFILKGSRSDKTLILCFSAVYIFLTCLTAIQPQVVGIEIGSYIGGFAKRYLGDAERNIIHTLFLMLGIILTVRIWRGAVTENDFFRLSRKPLVIGISGDSGAGKDFLVDSLRDLFGRHSVAHISGDDYHLWDRHKPMWQVLTHLNPKANDLERFARDLMALIDGKTIFSRHYDHETGKMTMPRRMDSNDFILASGLHTLHMPILRNCYDLSVYLDIDESLRRFFKIQRDVHVRGHTIEKVLSSIEKRKLDSERFIRKQMKAADLVLSMKPQNPRILELENTTAENLRYKLQVTSRHGFNEESLTRVLVGICGMQVDMALPTENDEVVMTIEGDVTGDDIQLAANHLFPEMKDFLDDSHVWRDGIAGLMQLVALSHVNQSLSRRLI